jgi:hypothetical protein
LIWCKARNSTSRNTLTDSVRGADRQLWSDLTTAEQTNSTDFITSFDSDGFTSGPSASGTGSTNENNGSFVAWNWLAGGTGSSNTDGSITSTVSANPSAGFSIVSYTAQNAVRTIGHGLGVAPKLIIVKDREAAQNWAVYHGSLGATKAVYLDTSAKNDTNSGYWNNTAPTSTVFSIGTNTRTGGSTNDYVAYCFAEVEGYSKFGGYKGNGNADGPFVYCGFRPAFVLIKNYAGGSETNWIMRDSARSPYNKVLPSIYANTNAAEINNFDMDFSQTVSR